MSRQTLAGLVVLALATRRKRPALLLLFAVTFLGSISVSALH